MAGLLDYLMGNSGADNSPAGLLNLLRNNAAAAVAGSPGAMPSDTADYGSSPATPPPMSLAGPNQQQPQPGPANVPMPQSEPAQMPHPGPAPMSLAGAPPKISAPPTQMPQPAPAPAPGFGDRLSASLSSIQHTDGIIPALVNGISGFASGQRTDEQGRAQSANERYLAASGVDPASIAAARSDPELIRKLVQQRITQQPITAALKARGTSDADIAAAAANPEYLKTVLSNNVSDDKTPQSVLEYQFYTKNLAPGQQPMDYATWSTAKARAGATNINNNVDMNSGVTYDKQLSEGLGKAHTALATGVEDAQTRARDVAAMQGAIDAIQKNGGTTGGLGQQQVLDLKKTVNAGASALGVDQPFSEADLADKEFLTKFNRSMAGAQAKGAVGSRVTNFEMSNYLKANPGLDMSVTGNQRLLGIQAQIEQRNIAVGNAIRDATAQAISQGQKINPVTVQKIITDYDEAHHIKDVVTGQDLTQSYALPEFQSTPSNASMANAHSENLKAMEKTIGGTTYVQRNGQWYPK